MSKKFSVTVSKSLKYEIPVEAENEKLLKINADLHKKIDNLQKKDADDNAVMTGLSPMTVYFDIGKTVLDEKELQHLDYFAGKILDKVTDDMDIVITVMGSADSNTGTSNRNIYLSEERGRYVMNLLKDRYAISPDQMTVRSEVVKAVGNPELSRAVMISF